METGHRSSSPTDLSRSFDSEATVKLGEQEAYLRRVAERRERRNASPADNDAPGESEVVEDDPAASETGGRLPNDAVGTHLLGRMERVPQSPSSGSD